MPMQSNTKTSTLTYSTVLKAEIRPSDTYTRAVKLPTPDGMLLESVFEEKSRRLQSVKDQKFTISFRSWANTKDSRN